MWLTHLDKELSFHDINLKKHTHTYSFTYSLTYLCGKSESVSAICTILTFASCYYTRLSPSLGLTTLIHTFLLTFYQITSHPGQIFRLPIWQRNSLCSVTMSSSLFFYISIPSDLSLKKKKQQEEENKQQNLPHHKNITCLSQNAFLFCIHLPVGHKKEKASSFLPLINYQLNTSFILQGGHYKPSHSNCYCLLYGTNF